MQTWNTDYEPEVGDMGQFKEWDAEVVSVDTESGMVTIEIFDNYEGGCLVDIPYRILWG